MNDFITVQEAATILDVSVQAVYQNIRRGVLKYKRIKEKLYTTQEWIREYSEHVYSRQEHATFNGKPVFNPDKGEYSLQHVGQMLGISEHQVYWYMKLGKYKGLRRGYYWVITADQLPVAMQFFKEKAA